MIIVSQNKTAHINYDNIEATSLLKKDDKIQINMRGNYDYTIGEYETMERAKEILEEIIELYMKCNCDSYGAGFGYVTNAVFEMPLE